MLATHAHALALPRMQRAQRACSAKDVGGRVGRENPVQAIAASRQRVVSCKRTRDSVRGISEQSGGQWATWHHAAGSEQQASRQQAMQAAGSRQRSPRQRTAWLEDDARLVVGPTLLVVAADHVDHRSPRLQRHVAQRGIEEACAKSGQRAVSWRAHALRASDARRSSAPARDAVGSSRAQQIASSEQAARIRQRATQAAGSRQRAPATFSGPHWPDRCRACRAGAANFG